MFEEVQDIFNIHRNRDGYTELKCGRGERKVCYVFIAILHLFYHYDSAPFLSSLRFCTFLMILTIVNLHQIYIIYFQGYLKCAVTAKVFKKANGGRRITMPEPRPTNTCGEVCDMKKRKNCDYIDIKKSARGMIGLGN